MTIYKIPVTWEVYSQVEVGAESLEKAIAIAKEDNFPLPRNWDYVDDSFEVNSEVAFEINNDKGDKGDIEEFLRESNSIEKEYTEEAFKSALRAWEYAITDTVLQDIGEILNIHYILMRNLHPDIAGKLRTRSITIGGQLKVYQGEALLKSLLYDWINFYGTANTEEKIKEAHIVFEQIHPFEDGNGRVGRLIKACQEIKAGLPIQIIHEGKEQLEYYKWFK